MSGQEDTKPPRRKKWKIVSISLPRELLEEVDQIAHNAMASRSAIIRKAVKFFANDYK